VARLRRHPAGWPPRAWSSACSHSSSAEARAILPTRRRISCACLADQAAIAIVQAQLYGEAEGDAPPGRGDGGPIFERSQEQLVKTERPALRALGEMAGGRWPHDFNNLLSVILGRAELMLRRRARGRA